MINSEELFRPLIWVEGIIGAGKSTFSREISSRLNLRLIEEPVETNPYLEKFYQNPKEYAFGMQMFLLHKRYIMQRLAADEATGVGGYDGAILDRSLSGDRVFAKLHNEAGNINDLDWKTYEMAYNYMCRTLLPPTLLIYLDVQPQTAYDRMKTRNRKAEAGVTLDYLCKLRKGYQEILTEAEQSLLPWSHAIRILRIPFDFDIHSSLEWDAIALTVKDSCKIT
jgi:deoxyadenosine/deoxycytidine kinase